MISWKTASFLVVGCVFVALAMFFPNPPVQFWLPYNGTWQNFYAVDRMAHGQYPYVDFLNYLGFGHAAFIYPIFYALHETYVASQIAASLVVWTSLFLSCLVVLRTIGVKSWDWPFLALALFGVLLVLGGMVGINSIYMAYNSMIGFRIAGTVLVPWLALMAMGVHVPWIRRGLIGILTGAAVFWSNDAGPVAAVAVLCMALCLEADPQAPGLAAWRRARIGHVVETLLISIPVAVASILIIAMLITGENPRDVLRELRTIADFQSWYYAVSQDRSVDTISDAAGFLLSQPEVWMTLGIGVVAFGDWIVRRSRWSLLLSAICGAALSLSIVSVAGGTAQVRYLLGLRWLTGLVVGGIAYRILIYSAMRWLPGKIIRKSVPAIMAIFSILVAGVLLVARMNLGEASKRDAFVATELGGPVTSYYASAIEHFRRLKVALDADGVLPERRFFSLYWGGLDIVGGARPSFRQNYIIHAMSEDDRLEWRNSATEFPYATTLSPSTSNWFVWNERANWDVVSEIYTNFDVERDFGHNILWKRRKDPRSWAEGPECTVKQSRIGKEPGMISYGAIEAGKFAEIAIELDGGSDLDSIIISSKRDGYGFSARAEAGTLRFGMSPEGTGQAWLQGGGSHGNLVIVACSIRLIDDPLFTPAEGARPISVPEDGLRGFQGASDRWRLLLGKSRDAQGVRIGDRVLMTIEDYGDIEGKVYGMDLTHSGVIANIRTDLDMETKCSDSPCTLTALRVIDRKMIRPQGLYPTNEVMKHQW